MGSFSKKRPSPALIISMLALFAALSGVAIASVPNNSVNSNKVKNNSLKSVDIKDKEIKGADVKDNSLKGADIDEASLSISSPSSLPPSGSAGGDLDGSYPNPTIGANKVTTGKVAADTLTAADLAANSVGSSEIATDAVGSAEIAANAVGASEIGGTAVGAQELGDNIHVHSPAVSGNAVDGTALDGDWNLSPAVVAPCGAGEEVITGNLTWTGSGDELALHELIVNDSAENVTGRGISDDGGTKPFSVTAICSF